MTIKTESADGVSHEFPDGTKPEVVDKAMKDYAANNKPSLMSQAFKTVGDIPGDIAHDFLSGAKTIKDQTAKNKEKIQAGGEESFSDRLPFLAGAMQEAFSPITGTARAIVGDPIRKAAPKGAAGEFAANVGEDVATLLGPAAISKSLATAGKMLPSYSKAVQRLLDEGVTLTPGQIAHRWAHGIVKGAEDATRSTPIVGNFIASAQKKSFEDFNRVVLNKALAPIGEKLPRGVEMGPQAIAHVEEAIGRKYDTLLPKLTLRLDNQYVTDLTDITKVAASRLPPAQRQQLTSLLTDIHSRIPNGTVNGFIYKQIEAELNYVQRMYARAADPAQREFSRIVTDVRGALKDTLERSNPSHAGELQDLNSAWAAFSRAQGASIRRVKSAGIFSPADLLGDIKTSSPRGVFARGHGLLQDIASAGDQVLPSSVPDSGTANRILWPELIAAAAGGGNQIGIHVPAAIGVAALPYTRVGMAATNAAARGVPKAAGAATRAIGESAPITGPAAVAAKESNDE
jgi:hypothetical protein